MSSVEPTCYRLSPKALDDLDDVWRYTAEMWSIPQADRYIDELTHVFETLVTAPTLGRERTEFTPLLRTHPHKNHIIIYTISKDSISIVRILGGRQNWQAILHSLDL